MIRERGHTNGDVALALLFYGGLAGGVLITGLDGQGASSLHSYLFGSLTSIRAERRVVHARAGRRDPGGHARAAPPAVLGRLRPGVRARSPGCAVRAYNLLVAVLAAVTVTVAMRTVGLLLVSALMVVPVATSQQLARSFRTTLAGAMGVGVVAAVGGLLLSAALSVHATVAPGPTIVLLALAMFASTWPLGVWLRHRRRLRAPFPAVPPRVEAAHTARDDAEEHAHVHGNDCGHPAVQHGDHVDYVHDGHRHAPHGEHYDEH